jgi:MFS family permease
MGTTKSAKEYIGTAGAGVTLAALILTETVANLNLSVANVALPSIGNHFDASQTALNLVAVSYSLGLAASVLYLGAVGDRYGRKLMLMLGLILSIPACLIAAFAPSIEVLIVGRLLGGLSAGMAYPTTLALITALWSGAGRTKAIALWSGLGGAMNAVGPISAGALLLWFDWRSVFLITLPIVGVAILFSLKTIPAHLNENTEPVDHIGGVMSAICVASAVLAINFATVPGSGTASLVLAGIAIVTGALFFLRQKKVKEPLFDLLYAKRPTFWVAALGGMIVFGSLMGAMFIGQQFLQNVLGYSTFDSGLSIIPGALAMVIVAPHSAKLVEAKGARFTLLCGYLFCLAGFLMMLLTWGYSTPFWAVGVPYALVGAGVGLAGTPASHSLTGSVPVRRVGMASGTADLQRDLGGAVMQSILGALLTAGYAKDFANQIAASPQASSVSQQVQSELTKSFSSAAHVAEQYPQYSTQIVAAAKHSFVQGQDWAYIVGMLAIALGAALIWKFFPDMATERELLAEYGREDDLGASAAGSSAS